MITEQIRQRLFALADETYRDFQAALTPTVAPGSMIGVRTPQLRALAKEFAAHGEIDTFLAQLPHRCFEENQLHAFVISLTREFDACIRQVEAFLPFVDNWATCDQMSPKAFAKNRAALGEYIDRWMASGHAYTVRFAVKMRMDHFLGAEFDPRHAAAIAALRSEEYYVKMMQAWYFATALAKQYDAVLPFLQSRALAVWTHNKAIQKARESNRIPQARKEYLKTLRIPTDKQEEN